MKKYYNNMVTIIIPTYNPDDKFLAFLLELKNNGYNNIIVVDDGSRDNTRHYFITAKEKFNCKIVSHSINLGQGRAYKSGFNYYLSEIRLGGYYENTIGIIQCDCDGQHHIDDINKCVELLRRNPEKLVLGIRDFSDKSIPFRSRFGNRCTSFVFKFFCGMDLKDTQTGLKGIPKSFIPVLMETSGERFEYASSCLLETKRRGIDILQFPIQTIYINGNETSHFNPILDSIRVYSLIAKYLVSSLSAFIADIIAFSFFMIVTKTLMPESYIIISTYLAKVISCTYSFIINKKLVFTYEGDGASTMAKFLMLCVVQATLSGFLTNSLSRFMQWNEVFSKIIIDTLLFFFSFQVQDRWVFKK